MQQENGTDKDKDKDNDKDRSAISSHLISSHHINLDYRQLYPRTILVRDLNFSFAISDSRGIYGGKVRSSITSAYPNPYPYPYPYTPSHLPRLGLVSTSYPRAPQ